MTRKTSAEIINQILGPSFGELGPYEAELEDSLDARLANGLVDYHVAFGVSYTGDREERARIALASLNARATNVVIESPRPMMRAGFGSSPTPAPFFRHNQSDC